MFRYVLSVSLNLLLFACRCSAASPAIPKAGDLAAAARTVFAAKCVECHGAEFAQPEGRFGYVLDLARVAANPEMVIRSSPEESELWELVRRGEMPPAGATAGPLSEDEKEVIRSWIAAAHRRRRPHARMPRQQPRRCARFAKSRSASQPTTPLSLTHVWHLASRCTEPGKQLT